MDGRKELLKKCRYFILDMDGTFYLGNEIIDGSLEFIEKLKATGREFLFFTNNSSKSPEVYIKKLAGMNCHITRDQIMTSGDVTIRYLKTYFPQKTIYLVGTEPLVQSFKEAGLRLISDMPDIVVIGFDTTLTYEKLERACTYIRNGADFFATHCDINCPTEHGFIPDVGAFNAAITLSTGGKQPRYFGKPCEETIEMILAHTHGRRHDLAFVGDRLYTDVATGVKNGVPGLLVLTGEATMEDVAKSDVKPDAIFKDLKEIASLLD
ncbi:HAD-IIA family hydrolase [Treponema parvum]|uniref:HAD-IIA family hydrolase n=1 Tax=Treponema parvum TaxID=138851 RepID=A0A975F0J1_9SPIR|nr:HAD-IIA family hydrolase [Treponema parvum]QTQ12216.1 HAD-IIA family hydrolase [Treponema parvum]